jgi:hypothetical protein
MADLKRTAFAQAATDMASYFQMRFIRARVAGACEYAPVLTAPEGMSTGGGKQARQHITLKPVVQGYRAVTIGWLDLATRSAMLRTWVCLEGMHRQRFPNQPFDVNPQSYQTFFDQAAGLFREQAFHCHIEQVPPPLEGGPSSQAAAASSSTRTAVWILLGLVTCGLFVVAAAAVVYFRTSLFR